MKRISLHPGVVLTVAAVGMLAAAGGGPDFGRYRAWMFAFVNVDLFAIASSVGSPLGLPVTTWSHAPGAYFALPFLVLGPVVGALDAPLVAGWASTLVFWWASFRVLKWAARDDSTLVALGAGMAFIGTHAGFYTRAHASESLALAAIALLMLAVVDPDPRPIRASWTIGCAAALLFVTRTYYVVYALPALALAGDSTFTGGRWLAADGSTGASSSRTAVRSRLLAGAAVALPLLAAAAQQALVNRWMTGSMLKSPYVFGDATYHSMNWLDPQIAAVLLHPWHGLLVYHPLYALGFVALLVCWRRASTPTEQVLWSGATFAVLINLWVQGAWHVWWLGTGTFGMRGMAAAAVFLVPALVRAIADARPAEHTGWADVWVIAGVACSLWSIPLLVLGNTQLYTWTAIIEAQVRGLGRLGGANWLISMGIGALLVIGVLAWARQRGRLASASVTAVIGGAALAVLALGYVLAMAHRTISNGSAITLVLPAVLLLVALGAGSILWHTLVEVLPVRLDPTPERFPAAGSADPARRLVAFVVGSVFLLTTLLFARLAIDTERRLANDDLPPVRFTYTATYEVQRAIVGLREYQRIRGFEERKRALREFLLSQGARIE